MVNLEDDVVEKIIKALERFNDGAVGIPGHPAGALITMLKEKLEAAKKPVERRPLQVEHLTQGFGRGARPKVPKRTPQK